MKKRAMTSQKKASHVKKQGVFDLFTKDIKVECDKKKIFSLMARHQKSFQKIIGYSQIFYGHLLVFG